jgi:hypothetical protein
MHKHEDESIDDLNKFFSKDCEKEDHDHPTFFVLFEKIFKEKVKEWVAN